MSKPRALLVDDDESWRDILQELLEDCDFEVSVADTLELARTLLSEHSFKVAVVDLSLGGDDHRNQDGLSVLDSIALAAPHCQAILLTGYATVELAVSVITEGKAITCLRKESFSRAEFREMLDKTKKAAPISENTKVESAPPSNGRALVVEDDAGWRELLSELLAELGLSSVSCPSFAEARGHLEQDDWQLAVIDLQLSSSVEPDNQDGLKLLKLLHEMNIPGLVVSGTSDTGTIEGVFESGDARGFFEKQNFSRSTFLQQAQDCLEPSALARLTEREREVLDLLAEGLTNGKIGEKLFISPNTVKRHLKAVFEKLGVSNRAAAAALVTRGK